MPTNHNWSLYRLGQEIPPDHIEAIKQGRYCIKGHGHVMHFINDVGLFAYQWNYVDAYLLARYTNLGMLAIHDHHLAAEFPDGSELYLEIHVDLAACGPMPALKGYPILFYHKWFTDDSVDAMMPDGDMGANREIPDDWKEPPLPGGDFFMGAWRFTLLTNSVKRQRIVFPRPFAVVPHVTASVMSRNLPTSQVDEIRLCTEDHDSKGFTIVLTSPPSLVWVRCTIGWEAIDDERRYQPAP